MTNNRRPEWRTKVRHSQVITRLDRDCPPISVNLLTYSAFRLISLLCSLDQCCSSRIMRLLVFLWALTCPKAFYERAKRIFLTVILAQMLSLSLCVFMCRKVNFMGISRKHTSLTLFVVSGQDLRYRYPPPWDKDTGIDLCRCTYLTPAWRLCKIRCMWYCGRMEAPIEHRRNQYEESRRTVNSEAICIFRRTLGLLLNESAFHCLRSVINMKYTYETLDKFPNLNHGYYFDFICALPYGTRNQ